MIKDNRSYVVLLLGHLCSLITSIVERVADLEVLSFLRELLQKLIVNVGMNENPRTGTASLSLVPAVKSDISTIYICH
jgi:hypothetical protein